jgi:retron-type reverse transcriptase
VRTQLERIAEKSRRETNFQFTSLAHHLTPELIWSNLNCIPVRSATGIDGKTVTETKETFDQWIDGAISSIHRKSYKAPAVRRVYIPKPGKEEKRPIGVPTVMDRAIQRSVAEVLSYIYEQDFLDCSSMHL